MVPPIFGLGFLVFVVELFDLHQLGLIMLEPPLTVFIIGAQLLSDIYFRRFARPIVAFLEEPGASTEAAALKCAGRFTSTFWTLFLTYLILAPVAVMASASMAYGLAPQPMDWFRIGLVALVVSIIVGLPIFFLVFDLFGEVFRNVRLLKTQLSIQRKVFLIGALVPLLIDTMLVQYYWSQTGYFTFGTFLVWLVLELLAIAGAVTFVRSFRQALEPLQGIMSADVEPEGIDLSQLRPHSTDELGVLASGYRHLLEKLQLRNDLLQCRSDLLRQTQTGASLADCVEAIRAAVVRETAADDAIVALLNSEGDELRIVAYGNAGFRRKGHLLVEKGMLGWDVMEANKVSFVANLTGDESGRRSLQEELGCGAALFVPLRADGETIGLLAAAYAQPRADPPGERAQILIEGIAIEASTVLHAALLRDRGREAELRYQQLSQFAPDAIIVLDQNLRVLSANETGQKLLGVQGEPRAPRELTSFVPLEESKLAVRAQFEHASAGEIVTFETTLRGEEEKDVYVEVRAKRLEVEPVRILALIRDISDRKRLEAQLMHSQRLEGVGRFAGGVAHDFNNLLTAVMGSVSLLEVELEEQGIVTDELREIQQAADRASVLTSQMLAFSRRQVLRAEVLDLNSVAKGIENLLMRLLPSNLELKLVLDKEPWNTHADRGQLEQVLVNLVINGRDAIGDEGAIRIETENVRLDADERVPSGDWVVLRVRDTGEGMTPEVMARLFEPYFTTKDPSKGTGLGLSMAYGIITQSGGHLIVDSTAGEGSVFCAYLPRTLDKQLRPSRQAPARLDTASKATVLLVDDDDDLRAVVKRVLQRAGMEVLEASRGDEALDTAASYPGEIDLLLCDVVMPGLKGPEVARRLRELRPSARVLIMSGYADMKTIEQLARGGYAFIAKPFAPRALKERLQSLLSSAEQSPGD